MPSASPVFFIFRNETYPLTQTLPMLAEIYWNADPILFSLGPVSVRWSGLAFALGFFIGYQIVAAMFKHEGAPVINLTATISHSIYCTPALIFPLQSCLSNVMHKINMEDVIIASLIIFFLSSSLPSPTVPESHKVPQYPVLSAPYLLPSHLPSYLCFPDILYSESLSPPE